MGGCNERYDPTPEEYAEEQARIRKMNEEARAEFQRMIMDWYDRVAAQDGYGNPSERLILATDRSYERGRKVAIRIHQETSLHLWTTRVYTEEP